MFLVSNDAGNSRPDGSSDRHAYVPLHVAFGTGIGILLPPFNSFCRFFFSSKFGAREKQ